MSGLIVKTAVVPGTAPVVEAPIENDGWFPDIDPAALRKEQRIRDSVTAERLRAAIIAAIITVGNQLAAWQAGRMTSTPTKLADVPSPKIDGESRYVLLYHAAIAAYAKSKLVEGYRDTDTTTAGQRDVEDLEPTISELRRDGIHAIRDILGRGRTDIELI
jgi:hypothetical protein